MHTLKQGPCVKHATEKKISHIMIKSRTYAGIHAADVADLNMDQSNEGPWE